MPSRRVRPKRVDSSLSRARARSASSSSPARVPLAAAMARRIVGRDRFLEPGQIEWLKGTRGADRPVYGEFHVGIGHQRHVRAKGSAQRLHPRHVLRQPRPPDLHLDRAVPLGNILMRLVDQRVGGQVQVDPAGVARHKRVIPAQ